MQKVLLFWVQIMLRDVYNRHILCTPRKLDRLNIPEQQFIQLNHSGNEKFTFLPTCKKVFIEKSESKFKVRVRDQVNICALTTLFK